jgi:diadenosine tetraphosphate (Ap4A) HIT family hydrolase
MTDDWKQDRIGAAQRGENPMVITQMPSGYAVIGDSQMLPGYCVLLSDREANHLTDLPPRERSEFLLDMSLVGEAILQATGCLRVNYAIYGNTDAYLHAHIIPRYDWEPEEFRVNCPMRYPMEKWQQADLQYDDEQHGDLRARIRDGLLALLEPAQG